MMRCSSGWSFGLVTFFILFYVDGGSRARRWLVLQYRKRPVEGCRQCRSLAGRQVSEGRLEPDVKRRACQSFHYNLNPQKDGW